MLGQKTEKLDSWWNSGNKNESKLSFQWTVGQRRAETGGHASSGVQRSTFLDSRARQKQVPATTTEIRPVNQNSTTPTRPKKLTASIQLKNTGKIQVGNGCLSLSALHGFQPSNNYGRVDVGRWMKKEKSTNPQPNRHRQPDSRANRRRWRGRRVRL